VRVLVTGAAGQVGSEIVRQLERRSGRPRDRLEVVAADHTRLDVSSRDQVIAALSGLGPDVVFHLAAMTDVDGCEEDVRQAFAVNSLGCRHLAEASRMSGAHLVSISTDYVFDGLLKRPYVEWDEPKPLSVYGLSKLGGERELGPSATVVRTAWLLSERPDNIVQRILSKARGSSSPLRFVDDRKGSPTVASELAGKLIELGLGRRPGTFHVSGGGEATWFDLARQVLASAGLDPERVEPVKGAELKQPAERPANSVLQNAALEASGSELLPDWHDSLERLVSSLP
jgi:dTDP-4-dehydrorhamnose reductase